MNKKKGFVYTLFVMAFLLALSVLILSQERNFGDSLMAEKLRSDEMGFFVKGIEEDLQRGMAISGRKSVLSLVNEEVNSGRFGSGANESIKELLENGSYEGEASRIMENSTILAWESSLRNIGAKRSIDVNVSSSNLAVAPISAFSIAIQGSAKIDAYDPLTRIRYNRSAAIREIVTLEELEDPYITIRSYGTVANVIRACPRIYGTNYSNSWKYGLSYPSTDTDLSGVGLQAEKILITNTLSGKSGYEGFKAIISESDDPPIGQDHIFGVAGAYGAIKNNTYVVMLDNALWVTNGTSCYFEAPEGPSFLDRLEGRGFMSTKYDTSDAIEGIGSFVSVYPTGIVLDYSHYG